MTASKQMRSAVAHVERAMTVKTIPVQDAYAFIEATHVSEQAFRTELEFLMKVRAYEGHPLGFMIVWNKTEDSNDMVSAIMNRDMHKSWKGKALSDRGGRAAQLFLLDGGTMLDCKTGIVEATTVHFASRASCPFIMDGHGTKHQSAVNLSFNWDVVVMVRSVDSSDITIFASALTRRGEVARVSAPDIGTPSNMVTDEAISKGMFTPQENGQVKAMSKGLLTQQKNGQVKSEPPTALVHFGAWFHAVQALQGFAIVFLLCSRFMSAQL